MTLVIGVGNPDRGDDGVGPAVAARVAALGLSGVRVAPTVDPARLIDAWDGESDVVVVDAVRVGLGDGPRVVSLRVDEQPLPGWAACGGTHAFSVASAIELSRALGRLPEHLVVVGVAGCDFSTGHGLSSDVRGRMDAAIESVRAAVHGAHPTQGGPG